MRRINPSERVSGIVFGFANMALFLVHNRNNDTYLHGQAAPKAITRLFSYAIGLCYLEY